MSVSHRGGFLDHDGGSQGPTSPAKSKSLAQSIVPVTIKEILELQVSMSGDGFTIQTEDVSLDVGNVVLVACVRSMRESATGVDYVLEDGTASIGGKCWQDKCSIPVECGTWARVVGSVRSINDSRNLNIFSIKPILNSNEITLHFLQAISLVTSSQKNVLAGFEYLQPIQKAIIEIYQKSTSPQGLHHSSVVRALADRYSPDDIRDSISWLISEGYIYETHDSDHAKIVSVGP